MLGKSFVFQMEIKDVNDNLKKIIVLSKDKLSISDYSRRRIGSTMFLKTLRPGRSAKNMPRKAASAIGCSFFVKLMFSLDVFFDFLGIAPNGMIGF